MKAAIDREGPFYLRLSREAFPAQYQPGAKFALGKAMRLRAGRDVTIIACGIMVGRAMEAAERLALAGVDAGVVDMFTIKPLDGEAVLLAAQESGAVVVAEEHSRHGGLGAAVSQVLARHGTGVPVRFVALNDTHTESGAYSDILEKYGLGTAHIVRACRSAVAAKPVSGM